MTYYSKYREVVHKANESFMLSFIERGFSSTIEYYIMVYKLSIFTDGEREDSIHIGQVETMGDITTSL